MWSLAGRFEGRWGVWQEPRRGMGYVEPGGLIDMERLKDIHEVEGTW